MLMYALGTHAGNQVKAAGQVLRVEQLGEANQLIGVGGGADFDPDRIQHATQKLYMGAIRLPGAVADPQHMGRTVIPVATEAVLASQGLLVIEQ